MARDFRHRRDYATSLFHPLESLILSRTVKSRRARELQIPLIEIINWTKRGKITLQTVTDRRTYVFLIFRFWNNARPLYLSACCGRACESRRYQGNRMAAINLARYNRTKKVRPTFITAISLALMTFAARVHVRHVTYPPYNIVTLVVQLVSNILPVISWSNFDYPIAT